MVYKRNENIYYCYIIYLFIYNEIFDIFIQITKYYFYNIFIFSICYININ